MADIETVKRRRTKGIPPENFGAEEEKQKEETAKKAAIEQQKDPVYILNQLRKESDEARAPHKNNWTSNWSLYNNDYDFSQKAPWQSKNYVAMVPVIVRGIKYLIKRALVTAGDFFDIELPGIDEKNPAKDKAKVWATRIIRKVIDDNKFSSVAAEALAASLLESLIILKVLPVGNSGISITAQSAFYVRLDPSKRKRYMIHSVATDLDQVLASAEKGSYDKEEVKKCQEQFVRDREAYESAARAGQAASTSVPKFRKEVIIDEFYGDLISGDGELLYSATTFTVLNEQYLIRKPTPIKEVFEHGKWPIVIGAPNPKPFSVYHQALISDVNGLAHMVTEILNLTIDTNTFAMARAFEIDMDQVYDAADLQDGIYPGKVYKKKVKAGKPDAPMIREIQIGGVPQQDLLIFESLKRQVQSDVGWYNEFSMADISRRPGGRATAAEVQERSVTSSSSMQSLAEEIEEQVIVPMLEQIWANVLQYFKDYKQFRGIVPDELIDMFYAHPNGMKAVFGDSAAFKAKGMSGVLNRLDELNKIMRFAQMAKMFPNLTWMLKAPNILKKVVLNFGWDADQFILDENEIKAREQQMAEAKKMEAMRTMNPGGMGMPPGMPPGAGGPM